jgi:hypothetical protein
VNIEGRIIIAEIEALSRAIGRNYDVLPEDAKAECIRLSAGLTKLKHQLERGDVRVRLSKNHEEEL